MTYFDRAPLCIFFSLIFLRLFIIGRVHLPFKVQFTVIFHLVREMSGSLSKLVTPSPQQGHGVNGGAVF